MQQSSQKPSANERVSTILNLERCPGPTKWFCRWLIRVIPGNRWGWTSMATIDAPSPPATGSPEEWLQLRGKAVIRLCQLQGHKSTAHRLQSGSKHLWEVSSRRVFAGGKSGGGVDARVAMRLLRPLGALTVAVVMVETHGFLPLIAQDAIVGGHVLKRPMGRRHYIVA